MVALIDDPDWPLVSRYKWRAKKSKQTFYAIAHDYSSGRDHSLRMHRLILGLTDPKEQGDHRDGNGLNNQRHNLRTASHSQNQWNTRRSTARSGFKGVFWDKRKKKWWARVGVHGFVGYFDDPRAAAEAYDAAALAKFGEFAATNKSLGRL